MVRDAVVLVREDEQGNKQVVAYITTDVSSVPMDQTVEQDAQAKRISQWQTVYNDEIFYQNTSQKQQSIFALSGWNSS